MCYTVKQLAELAGVSRRTLHFYDEIRLLEPAAYGENGYRYYDEAGLLRLQQILFYKELDFSLDEIRTILNRPDFDLAQALHGQKQALHARVARLYRLINTIDKTLQHLDGVLMMSEQEYYDGFDHQQYREEARERYGEETVRATEQRWDSYTPEQQEAILASQTALLTGIRDRIPAGHEDPEVQRLVRALHQHMGFFYDCSYERFAGLGRLYNEDPRFHEMYRTKYHPDMPAFLAKAIAYYCEQQSD